MLEIWGADSIKTTDPDKLTISMEKLACEKLNMSFRRFVLLGVHTKSQQSAMPGELDSIPLAVDTIANVIKYKEYLELKDKNSILHDMKL